MVLPVSGFQTEGVRRYELISKEASLYELCTCVKCYIGNTLHNVILLLKTSNIKLLVVCKVDGRSGMMP